jgi:hypothetical protein
MRCYDHGGRPPIGAREFGPQSSVTSDVDGGQEIYADGAPDYLKAAIESCNRTTTVLTFKSFGRPESGERFSAALNVVNSIGR